MWILLVACAPSPDPGGGRADDTAGRAGEDSAPEGDSAPAGGRDSAPDSGPDSAADSGPDPGDSGDTAAPPPPDLRLPGPEPTHGWSGTLVTTRGCALDYDVTAPAAWTTLVVLEHGLERGREQMAAWAVHLASWGVAVATPEACDASVTDLDQAGNGADMVDLARSLSAGPVIYAGHSAGGLAAFVATASDPAAVAMLGLDAVEWLGIGADHAAAVTVPAFQVEGEPSTCNLDNNFTDLFNALPQGRVLHLTDADHCDFETPTDWVCTLPCGTASNDRFSDAEIQATLMGLATGFVRWQAGLDASGEGWWSPGGYWYEVLLAAGAIEPR